MALVERWPVEHARNVEREQRVGVTRSAIGSPVDRELDARGVTRRRDDLRIAGPRLPDT